MVHLKPQFYQTGTSIKEQSCIQRKLHCNWACAAAVFTAAGNRGLSVLLSSPSLKLFLVDCFTVLLLSAALFYSTEYLLDRCYDCFPFRTSVSSVCLLACCDDPRLDRVSLGSLQSWWKNDLIALFHWSLWVCVCAHVSVCACMWVCMYRCPLLSFIFKWNGYCFNHKFKKMKMDGWKMGEKNSPLWIKEPWNYSITQQIPHSAPAGIVPELFHWWHYFLTLPWSLTSCDTCREPHFDLFTICLSQYSSETHPSK